MVLEARLGRFVQPPFVRWKEAPKEPISVKSELMRIVRGFRMPALQADLMTWIERFPDNASLPVLLEELADMNHLDTDSLIAEVSAQIVEMAEAFEPIAELLTELGITYGITRNFSLKALMIKYNILTLGKWEAEVFQELNDIDIIVHFDEGKISQLIAKLQLMFDEGLIEDFEYHTNFDDQDTLLKAKAGAFASANVFISFTINGVEIEIFDDFYYLKDPLQTHPQKTDGICLSRLNSQGVDEEGTDEILSVLLAHRVTTTESDSPKEQTGVHIINLPCIVGYGTLLSYLLQFNGEMKKPVIDPSRDLAFKNGVRMNLMAVVASMIQQSGFIPRR